MKITSLTGTRMLLLFVVLALSPSLAQAEVVSGKVQNVIGDASIVLPNGKVEKVTRDTTIPAGSKLLTTPDSKMIVQWMPGALSVIGSDSTVAINSLAYGLNSAGAPQRKVGLNLSKGTVFSHLTPKSGKSDFSIRTPAGVAAARGTDWSVSVDGNKAVTVSVVSSEVDVTLNQGLVIGVKAGYLYSVNAGGEPVPLTQEQIDVIIRELRFAGIAVQSPIVGQITELKVNGPLRETPLTSEQFQASP